MEAKEFGEFIAETRKQKQITQAELAKKLNVTDKAVSRWERGLGFPDINTLEPLAEALGITLTELMSCSKTMDIAPIVEDFQIAADLESKTIAPGDEGIIASIDIAKKQRNKLNRRVIIGSAGCAACVCAVLCAVFMWALPSKNVADTELVDTDTSSVDNITKTEVVGRWIKTSWGTANSDCIYYPYVEDKVKGVSYVEELVGPGTTQENFISDNRPDGCISDIRKRLSFFASNIVQPDIADESVRWSDKRNKLTYVEQGEQLNVVEQLTGSDKNRYQIEKQDVQAISCALYEDFYDNIPHMTINVYGIPAQLWENTFGSEMVLNDDMYNSFITRCENNNFSELELLAQKDIDKTDVYYVDYNDLRSKGDYAQIIYVISFDERADYTFFVNGNAAYEIYDAAAYSEWKSQNIDKFIQ